MSEAPRNPSPPGKSGTLSRAAIDADETVLIPTAMQHAGMELDGDQTVPKIHDPSGRYQIHELIGKGGMAEVYRATDSSIKRQVALKLLHADLAADEDFRARFVAEATMAGNLAHPNIVVVHDVGVLGGRPFIAMELLEGETLAALLTKRTTFKAREVTSIGMQLGRALAYAHAQGVVHRDIKPSNVVMRESDGQVKVLDFGIAQVTGAADVEGSKTGDILGSAHYLSPEHLTGKGVDSRSDIFSVGIVLYQLLSGRKPFASDNFYTLTTQIVREDPAPLAQARPDVPPALRRVVEKCLRKEKERRFQTADDLADALGRVLRDMDEGAGLNRPRILPILFVWPVLIGIAALITLSVLGGTLASSMAQHGEDPGAPRASLLAHMLAERLSESMALLRNPSHADSARVEVEETTRPLLQQFALRSLVVTDPSGMVVAAHGGGTAGERYVEPAGEVIATSDADVTMKRLAGAKGEGLYFVSATVRLKERSVGTLHLTLPGVAGSGRPVGAGALFGTLTAVTVLVVVLVALWLAWAVTKSMRLLRESMTQIANGNYDVKIHQHRSDDIGEVYRAFNRMAIALQRRSEGERDTTKFPDER